MKCVDGTSKPYIPLFIKLILGFAFFKLATAALLLTEGNSLFSSTVLAPIGYFGFFFIWADSLKIRHKHNDWD